MLGSLVAMTANDDGLLAAFSVGAIVVDNELFSSEDVASVHVNGKQNFFGGHGLLMQLSAVAQDNSNSASDAAQNNCCTSSSGCETSIDKAGCCVGCFENTSSCDGDFVLYWPGTGVEMEKPTTSEATTGRNNGVTAKEGVMDGDFEIRKL